MMIDSIDDALVLLRAGGVIAYPTETFYAIGCSAFKDEPLKRIYEIKQRDLSSPLPLIVRDSEQALEIVDIDEEIRTSFLKITKAFWPESLSICLRANSKISSIITANTNNVVLRQSPNSLVQEICNALHAPLISTSANKSGERAASSAEQVDINLAIDAILRSKNPLHNPQGGLPSTIIEIEKDNKIKMLRKGAFDCKKLEALNFVLKD